MRMEGSVRLTHGFFVVFFTENERRIRANDREFNAQFKYAVSIYLLSYV